MIWQIPNNDNDPQAAQSIINATGTINLWDGSVRARKTVTAMFAWLLFVTKNPKGEGLYIITGKTIDTIASNILIPLQLFLGQENFTFTLGARKAYLKNLAGQEQITFFLIGACNEGSETKIQGKTVFCALSDEGSLYPVSFLQMLFSRLSLDDSRMFMTTNPDSKNHYIYKNYIEKKDDPDVNIKYFQFQLLDNPYISDAKKKEFVSMYTGLWYRRYILGEWVAAQGAIYPQFNENIHVVDTAPFKNQCEFFSVPVDFGTKNPTVFLLIGKTKDDISVVFKSYYWIPEEHGGREKTTDEFSNDLFLFLSNNSINRSTVIVDPSASTLILSIKNRFKNSNLKATIKKADNQVEEGIAILCNLFYNNKMLIDKSCIDLIREVLGYSWKKDKPDKKNDHGPDCMRYYANENCTKKTLKIRHKSSIENKGFNRW